MPVSQSLWGLVSGYILPPGTLRTKSFYDFLREVPCGRTSGEDFSFNKGATMKKKRGAQPENKNALQHFFYP